MSTMVDISCSTFEINHFAESRAGSPAIGLQGGRAVGYLPLPRRGQGAEMLATECILQPNWPLTSTSHTVSIIIDRTHPSPHVVSQPPVSSIIVIVVIRRVTTTFTTFHSFFSRQKRHPLAESKCRPPNVPLEHVRVHPRVATSPSKTSLSPCFCHSPSSKPSQRQ